MPRNAALPLIGATTWRWLPPLRLARGFRGEPVVVRVTGRDAQRVLFGASGPRTGPRLAFRRPRQRQEDFPAFLRYPRQRYPGRPLWLLLDRAPCPDAVRGPQRAARSGVVLLWLPKQCPERSARDRLSKGLKRLVAADRQFRATDGEAGHAEHRIVTLTPRQALRKASALSDDFWLKDCLENFWLPT